MSTEQAEILPLVVSAEEAGQKLLQFLQRRLDIHQSTLHRLIRTGQIRLNGKRCQPFVRVNETDNIRLPPFACDKIIKNSGPEDLSENFPEPDILLQTKEIFILNKPCGLPVHGGSEHTDSLFSRMKAHYGSSPFIPTPAHRLDMDTSGLILFAKTYSALRALNEALLKREGLTKIYLAWASGNCPWTEPTLLEDGIVRIMDDKGYERMELAPVSAAVKKASLTVQKMKFRTAVNSSTGESLLRIILHTGRTGQIRVQMAGHGYPLLGDRKYGGPFCEQGLLLHAAELGFGKKLAHKLDLPDTDIFCPPPWFAPYIP